MNVTAAFPVVESSQIAEPRRVVQWLASRLDFSEERAGRAALIVSELATNLAKHARGGELLMRALTDGDAARTGIEVLALDKGPGIRDLARARRDGYSTGGTLGHGLGAIERQADWMDLYTHTSGTVIVARIWKDRPAAPLRSPRFEVGAVHVSKPGESVCGDAWDWRMRESRLTILVADGLGHGLPAHEAANAALSVFVRAHESSPARLLEGVHAALRGTRGAAVASLALDLERGVAVYAGIGNITATILLAGERQGMVSHNGTAGHRAVRIQEFSYPVPAGGAIVLFSDGLSSHWDLRGYPGLLARGPSLLAGVLYRDFSRRRDDVTIVVAKERTAVTEKV